LAEKTVVEFMEKEVILVADKVLIKPDLPSDKTDSGLYLPQGVKEKEKVNSGEILKVGPGYPVPDPSLLNQEPWSQGSKKRFFPLQAQEGDRCIFMREQAIEVSFEEKKCLVVAHSAILLLIRDPIDSLKNI
jgi:co-chaperonin GroES (HSP10)